MKLHTYQTTTHLPFNVTRQLQGFAFQELKAARDAGMYNEINYDVEKLTLSRRRDAPASRMHMSMRVVPL